MCVCVAGEGISVGSVHSWIFYGKFARETGQLPLVNKAIVGGEPRGATLWVYSGVTHHTRCASRLMFFDRCARMKGCLAFISR